MKKSKIGHSILAPLPTSQTLEILLKKTSDTCATANKPCRCAESAFFPFFSSRSPPLAMLLLQ